MCHITAEVRNSKDYIFPLTNSYNKLNVKSSVSSARPKKYIAIELITVFSNICYQKRIKKYEIFISLVYILYFCTRFIKLR